MCTLRFLFEFLTLDKRSENVPLSMTSYLTKSHNELIIYTFRSGSRPFTPYGKSAQLAVTVKQSAIEAVTGVELIGLCHSDSSGRQHQHTALNAIKDSF